MFQVKVRTNFTLDRGASKKTAKFILGNFGNSALQYMKKYPGQKNPDSKYVRGFGTPPNRTSEDLGARWTSKVTSKSNTITLIIANNASYAQWVQSRFLQAEVHKDWWQTEQDMIDELLPDLLSQFAKHLPSFIILNK